MEITGKIKMIGETQSFGTNGFQKREVVVTTTEQYPQHIMVEFVQDKCAILDGYAVGQDVTIGINLRGRDWTSPQGEVKYFNTIQGWRIENANPIPKPQTAENAEPIVDPNDDSDPLPF
jgi:hypothetical protein